MWCGLKLLDLFCGFILVAFSYFSQDSCIWALAGEISGPSTFFLITLAWTCWVLALAALTEALLEGDATHSATFHFLQTIRNCRRDINIRCETQNGSKWTNSDSLGCWWRDSPNGLVQDLHSLLISIVMNFIEVHRTVMCTSVLFPLIPCSSLDVPPTVMHKQKPVPPVFYWAIYLFFQIISRLLSVSKNRCRYQGLVPV